MNRIRLLVIACAALLASVPILPATGPWLSTPGHGPARNKNKRLRLS